MTQLLSGRGAVVIGGSLGIGAAVATQLARHGAGVVVNGREQDVAEQTAAGIAAGGGAAVSYPGSPADPAIAESLITRCIDLFGGVHILVNCAGIAEPAGSSILDISPSQFRELLDSHLGTVPCLRLAARRRPGWSSRAAAASSTPDQWRSWVITAAPAIQPAKARSPASRWLSLQNSNSIKSAPMSFAPGQRPGCPAGRITRPTSQT